MEFNEKLQILRKKKGITQEDLAEALYVSRTAVSKWESGRGYPTIDSLKAIAKFFSVTVDELLSDEELRHMTEETSQSKDLRGLDLGFGFADLSALAFFFVPFFGEKGDGLVRSVSLLSLTVTAPYLKAAYFAVVVGMILMGALFPALRNCREQRWHRNKYKLSIGIGISALLVFVASLQPYAAVFVFILLAAKAILLKKWQ